MSATSVTYSLKPKSTRAYNLYADAPVKSFMIPFKYQHPNQIVIEVDGELFTDYDLDKSTPIVLISGDVLRDKQTLTIYRSTDVEAPVPITDQLSTFTAGHPLKASDLNDNFALILQNIQEKLDDLQSQIDAL